MAPGVVGIVLADISGKGISAALLMANLQANLRSQYAVALDDLPRLLQSVNRLFYENTADESYATMFFGVYDDSHRNLRFANCGHIAPLILRSDGSILRLTSTTPLSSLHNVELLVEHRHYHHLESMSALNYSDIVHIVIEPDCDAPRCWTEKRVFQRPRDVTTPFDQQQIVSRLPPTIYMRSACERK